MPITPEQKVKALDTVSTTRFLNKDYENWWRKGEQNDSVKFEHENQSVFYTAKTKNGDSYEVLYYSNNPHLQSAKIKNDDGSIMTIDRVEDNKNTRYECNADGDDEIDYSFYMEYGEDGNSDLTVFNEDENGDGQFDSETRFVYENGKLKYHDSIKKNPETGKLETSSRSKFFGADPWYHQGEIEETTFYDSNGEKSFSIAQSFDETGRILEKVYNDYKDNDFWSRVMGKSNDYRAEYSYDDMTVRYYNSKGKLIKTENIEEERET